MVCFDVIGIKIKHDQIIEDQEQDKPADYQKKTPNDDINLGEEGRDSKDKLCNYHQMKLSLRLLLMSFDNAVREGDAQWLVDIYKVCCYLKQTTISSMHTSISCV